MSKEELKPGIAKAIELQLNPKELVIFQALLDKPMTTNEVAQKLNGNAATLKSQLRMMSLKNQIHRIMNPETKEFVYSVQ